MALPSSLLNGWTHFWPIVEVGGQRSALLSNDHLSDVATVGSGASLVQPLAADFVRASSEYLEVSDNSSLDKTGDFTISVRALINDRLVASQSIVAKNTLPDFQYQIQYAFPGTDLIRFIVSNDGTSSIISPATTFGQPPLGTWMQIIAWHDSVGQRLHIEVDGMEDSIAHTTGVHVGPAPLTVGVDRGGGSLQNFSDGRTEQLGLWDRVLTTVERAYIRNGSAGRDLSSIFGKVSPINYYYWR